MVRNSPRVSSLPGTKPVAATSSLSAKTGGAVIRRRCTVMRVVSPTVVAGTLPCCTRMAGGAFGSWGAAGICCSWLPAPGGSTAQAVWISASKVNGSNVVFKVILSGGAPAPGKPLAAVLTGNTRAAKDVFF